MSDIVILAGAGRSGTTILKDVLSKHKDINCFEFEMNALWKMGNEKIKHDRLILRNLEKAKKKTIKRFILKASKKSGSKIFIDKTVANVMRLHFISELLPNAKIIYLERDGRAVAISASKRWESKEKNSYYLKKFLAMPINARITIIFNKLKSFLLLISKNKKSSTWGALWPNYECSIKNKSIIEKSAIQWNESIFAAKNDLRLIDNKRYIKVKYENILKNPIEEIKNIIQFLELDFYSKYKNDLNNMFDKERADAWKNNASIQDIQKIETIQRSLLLELGYINE